MSIPKGESGRQRILVMHAVAGKAEFRRLLARIDVRVDVAAKALECTSTEWTFAK
jgi:hypothetical protein